MAIAHAAGHGGGDARRRGRGCAASRPRGSRVSTTAAPGRPARRGPCASVFSRVTWNLLSYTLPWVAEAAGDLRDSAKNQMNVQKSNQVNIGASRGSFLEPAPRSSRTKPPVEVVWGVPRTATRGVAGWRGRIRTFDLLIQSQIPKSGLADAVLNVIQRSTALGFRRAIVGTVVSPDAVWSTLRLVPR
jgi:hypothetical protein